MSNPTDKRREAAEKYADHPERILRVEGTYTTQLFRNHVAVDAFLAGCKYESKEAEARGFQRAMELLRSDAAIKFENHYFDISYCLPSAMSWADWLEKQK